MSDCISEEVYHGENYKHPIVLLILGIIVVVISAYLGITPLGKLSALFG